MCCELALNSDQVTGGYARLFSDYAGVMVLSNLPAFAVYWRSSSVIMIYDIYEIITEYKFKYFLSRFRGQLEIALIQYLGTVGKYQNEKENKMKKKASKILMLTGVLCVIGVTVCACQSTKEAPAQKSEQEDMDDAGLGEDAADADLNMEPEKDDMDEENGNKPSSETGESNDSKEKPAETGESNNGSIKEDSPNLEGSIKEIKGTQLTVVEAITGQSECGGDIMVDPGSGDDSEFNKIEVTYDEDTVFVIKTIYDGGARFETEKGAVSDLAEGQTVQVWGTSTADGLKAAQISIVKVE